MIDETAEIVDSRIAESAQIYRFARATRSFVGERSVLGDWARLTDSRLGSDVVIDRNNHIHRITMGNFSYTGPNTVVMEAEIGNYCSLSWNVTIGPGDHDYKRGTTHPFLYHQRFLQEGEDPLYDRLSLPCSLEHDVWVGCGAVILRGVRVGTGAVVGANAVVTRDVPSYAVVAGSPARVLKLRFSESVIERFLHLEWWTWPAEVLHRCRELLGAEPTEEILERLFETRQKMVESGLLRQDGDNDSL